MALMPYLDYAQVAEFVPTSSSKKIIEDERGVPQVYYESWQTPQPGYHYNPITTVQYALRCFSKAKAYPETEGHKMELAKALTDWLLARQDPDGRWRYLFSFYMGGCKNSDGSSVVVARPWSSGLVQGQALSLLARMHQEFGRADYLAAAERAVSSLAQHFDGTVNGGFKAYMPWANTYAIVEQYPTPKATFSLNTHLFALVGLADLLEVKPDSTTAKALYDEYTTKLPGIPGMYDGMNSIYGDGRPVSYYFQAHKVGYRDKPLAIYSYHKEHIKLLTEIIRRYPNSTLKSYRDRWASPEYNDPARYDN